MARMRAIEAAILVMRREGVDTAFGVPGRDQPHVRRAEEDRRHRPCPARHVEGASHMAEWHPYQGRQHRRLHRHLRPCRHRLITGLYSASADSIPILCITGQAPRARLHKEDFQAVDISSIAAPVASGRPPCWNRPGPLCIPEGLPADARRPARPGTDRPAVRRTDGRDRVRHRRLRAPPGEQAEGHPGPGRRRSWPCSTSRAPAAGGRRAASSTPTPPSASANSPS